jgi:spermidine synthase
MPGILLPALTMDIKEINMINIVANNTVLSRWVLLATVFITGASVLVIEIIGTRILSPFFGSGIYTWSSLIATTLGALALGYVLGGRFADKYPYPVILFSLCLSAGIWTMLTPWLAGMLLPQLVDVADMRVGIFFSSLMLFFPNLLFLGAICPFAIRLISETNVGAGTNSGLIFSVSTIGSLLAAIASGFILIPSYGVITIFSASGFILAALSILGYGYIGLIKSALLTALMSVLMVYMASTYQPAISGTLQLLDSEPSFYGQVQVIQKESFKTLLVDGVGQNYVAENNNYVTDDNAYVADYIKFISLVPQLLPAAESIQSSLVIGLGAGELPMLLANAGLQVDVVEIDPIVKLMAEKHFAFELPQEQIFIADGRYFLSHTEKKYDYIVLDAFNSDQVAWHLLSREALQTTRKRLSEHGLLAINFTSQTGSKDIASLQATLNKVFAHVRLFDQDVGEGLTSLVFIAADHAIELSAGSQLLSDRKRVFAERFILNELTDLGSETILSDDYNPVSYQRRQVQMQWRREIRDFLGSDQSLLLYN